LLRYGDTNLTKYFTICAAFALVSACAGTATIPMPPEGASPEEVQAFYSQVCTQQGKPVMTVEEAQAAGSVALMFANANCVDGYVLDYLQARNAGG
jgi:hypothetical protein